MPAGRVVDQVEGEPFERVVLAEQDVEARERPVGEVDAGAWEREPRVEGAAAEVEVDVPPPRGRAGPRRGGELDAVGEALTASASRPSSAATGMRARVKAEPESTSALCCQPSRSPRRICTGTRGIAISCPPASSGVMSTRSRVTVTAPGRW